RGASTVRALEALLAPLRDRHGPTVTRRDISGVLDRMVDEAPGSANRSLAYAKAFFAWAVGHGYMETTPAAAIAKPARETPRDRAPDLDELAEIWIAASDL